MAAVERREPRTTLEYLLLQQDRTYEETAAAFVKLAGELGEPATISARHLGRLARRERGHVGMTPATRRVLQAMFGRPVDELLRPWVGQVEPVPESLVRVSTAEVVDEGRVLAMAAQRARRFAVTAGQDGVSAEVVDQLHDDVQRLATAYPQQPLREILGDLVEAQDALFSLLERRQRPSSARQLYFLAGVASGLLAKASHDLAEPHVAIAQARAGYLCADHADHDGLRAWLRGLQSFVAYWAGRFQESVRYARAGIEYAARSLNTTAVWLPANEARAWAALGNAEQARAAIERAQDAWTRSRPDDLDELGGICSFSRTRALYYAADALAWLPAEAEAAERYSTLAVEAYRDTDGPDWAFGDQAGSHCDLAVARVARRQLDGASETLRPVLDLPPERRINGVIHSVQRVSKAIVHAGLAAEGHDLLDEIETFTRSPMRALPH